MSLTMLSALFVSSTALTALSPRQPAPRTPPPPLASASPQQLAPARLAIGATWLAAVGYAAIGSPGEVNSPADTELILKLFDTAQLSSVNPIFFSVFNSLGLLPLAYSAVLAPGARDQSPVPPATIATSFALGFGGLAPYLALRQARPEPIARSSLSFTGRLLENKLLVAVPVLLASLALAAKVATIGPAFEEVVAEYAALFATSKFVHISSLDLCVLSLFFFEPCAEDMMRRGWFPSDGEAPKPAQLARLAAFCALPVIGPALYLVLRPPLDE